MFWITIFMIMGVSLGSGRNSSSLLFIPADKLSSPEYADENLKYLLSEETIKQNYSPKNPANKADLTKTRLAIIYSQSCTIFSQGGGNFKIRLNTELYFEKVTKLFDIAYYAMEGITSSARNLRAQFFSRGFSNPNTKSVLDTIYDTLQASNLHEKFAEHVFNKHNISKFNWDKGLQNKAAKTIGAVKNAGNGLMDKARGGFSRSASANIDDSNESSYSDGPVIMGRVVPESPDDNQNQERYSEQFGSGNSANPQQAQYEEAGTQQKAAQAPAAIASEQSPGLAQRALNGAQAFMKEMPKASTVKTAIAAVNLLTLS